MTVITCARLNTKRALFTTVANEGAASAALLSSSGAKDLSNSRKVGLLTPGPQRLRFDLSIEGRGIRLS